MRITSKMYGPKEPRDNRLYPWVGQNTNYGHIVLFTRPNAGVMLSAPFDITHSAYNKPVGHYADCWHETGFVPWTGKIELLITGA